MSIKAVSNNASRYDENNAAIFTSRTGATSVLGGVGFQDVVTSDAASTSIAVGEGNVVAVTTALMAMRPPLVVWAEAGVADDKPGRAYCGDGIRCLINVNSTTDIAKGDWLKPVDAGDHMVKGTLGTDYVYAQALAARTSNDEGTIECLLYSSGKL